MHRFIIRIVLICGILWNGASYAHPISPAEQRWIDAHPIVHFSIHEKYAPYLQNQDEAGIFNLLLKNWAIIPNKSFVRNGEKQNKRDWNNYPTVKLTSSLIRRA